MILKSLMKKSTMILVTAKCLTQSLIMTLSSIPEIIGSLSENLSLKMFHWTFIKRSETQWDTLLLLKMINQKAYFSKILKALLRKVALAKINQWCKEYDNELLFYRKPSEFRKLSSDEGVRMITIEKETELRNQFKNLQLTLSLLMKSLFMTYDFLPMQLRWFFTCFEKSYNTHFQRSSLNENLNQENHCYKILGEIMYKYLISETCFKSPSWYFNVNFYNPTASIDKIMSKFDPLIKSAFWFSSNDKIMMKGQNWFLKFIKNHQKRIKAYIENIIKFDFTNSRFKMTLEQGKEFENDLCFRGAIEYSRWLL